MKIKTLLIALFLLTISKQVSAKAVIKSAAERATLVSSEMKSVDSCKNYFAFTSRSAPSLFGEGKQKIALQAIASMGQVAVGNDQKSFQLAVNKGIITSYINGKQTQVSYLIDSKAFISQLNLMNQFLKEVLEVAEKNGRDKDVDQVNCATAILDSTKKNHST
jgi:hypothetical protein